MSTVDVIIPAFNAAKYLPFALQSVLSQSYEDWKVLLVDDGSTDNTAQVASSFYERFGSRIQYIRQENRGLPAARNTAIRASSAEFLALLDADDVWLPCRLEESVRILQATPQAGLSYGGITGIDAEGRLGDTFFGNKKYAAGNIAPYIYMRKVELPCPTITFRRKCVNEVGLFDETMRATEDRDMWLRIALRYEVAFIPKVLAYYRVSANSMSTDPERMLRSQTQFIDKHYGAIGCGWLARRMALSQCYKQRADALSIRNRPWAALWSSLRSMGLFPFDRGTLRTAISLFLRCIRSLFK